MHTPSHTASNNASNTTSQTRSHTASILQTSLQSKGASKKTTKNSNLKEEGSSMIDYALSSACQAIGISPLDLKALMEKLKLIEDLTKLAFLRLIERYHLDPLLGEISVFLKENEANPVYLPLITIDGWIKIMNAQPTFQGVTFQEALSDGNSKPSWMECTIFRSDRIHPITVREYFAEVKTNQPIWQEMPMRMLRHKVLTQTVRLAFGISMGEPANLIAKTNNIKAKNTGGEQNPLVPVNPEAKSKPRMQLLKECLMSDQNQLKTREGFINMDSN